MAWVCRLASSQVSNSRLLFKIQLGTTKEGLDGGQGQYCVWFCSGKLSQRETVHVTQTNTTCQPDTAIEASLNDPTGRKKCGNLSYALGARGLKLGKISLLSFCSKEAGLGNIFFLFYRNIVVLVREQTLSSIFPLNGNNFG